MRLPTPLLRRDPKAHKNQFGHVLVLAGSPAMLGAAALCSLAAMRTGAGLVTVGIPRSLNTALQKKLSPVVMTWPLPQTASGSLSAAAQTTLEKNFTKFSVIAVGPGLSQNPGTQRLIRALIARAPIPLVIDADGLNALIGHLPLLQKTSTLKILTPHPGEMARLTGKPTGEREEQRRILARQFAQQHGCILLLKGHRTIIASPDGRTVVNTTGNSGLAKAGSGDVLTGMIAALVAQRVEGFAAATWGAYLHGRAADLAVRKIPAAALIASDLLDYIPAALRGCTVSRK